MRASQQRFEGFVRDFRWMGRPTAERATTVTLRDRPLAVKTFVNEYWTSRQRAAHSLHEISYRACFKPQLPKFFIERLTKPHDRVYDPFMGRGTTVLEAALMSRVPVGCDINPLSRILVGPRLDPPPMAEVDQRLAEIDWTSRELPADLLTFYHPETLREICALKSYLAWKSRVGGLDATDRWIRMVAINRLTGHSPGFFSVYTLPPNQAVSLAAQRKINEARGQVPPRRYVPNLILTKTASLLADYDDRTHRALGSLRERPSLLTGHAADTPAVESDSIQLVVTSPPFLDVVDYAGDNWLRCWFCEIDPADVKLMMLRKVEQWASAMREVFVELARVLKPGGHIAFEVGEIRGGRIRLEEYVIPCGVEAGLDPVLVMINAQAFTKTAKCWGVDNNKKGTNTNRLVLFRKPK